MKQNKRKLKKRNKINEIFPQFISGNRFDERDEERARISDYIIKNLSRYTFHSNIMLDFLPTIPVQLFTSWAG